MCIVPSIRLFLLCFFLFLLSVPALAQEQRRIVFRDDFSNNDHAWPTPSNGADKEEVQDGVYRISRTGINSRFYWVDKAPLNSAENYSIRARIRQIGGPTDWGYGLLWGVKDAQNINATYITSTKFCNLSRWYNGEYKAIVPWRKTDSVHPQGEWNLIEIRRENSAVAVFVNGGFAAYATVWQTPLYGSYIGFAIDSNSTIEVDSIIVEQWPISPIRIVKDADKVGQRENLGSSINSEYIELMSVISADGKTLYIDRRNSPANVGGINNQSDIWIATRRDDGTWNPAVNAGYPLNNTGSNSVIAALPDNNTLLVANHYNPDGSSSGAGVSLTRRIGEQWSVPENQTISGYMNKNQFATYNLAPDGKTLLLGIEDDNTLGDLDIYVSFLAHDGTWTQPRNIGPVVNSIGSDFGPFMAADGATMYYASDGKPGYGSHDIYMTRRLDSTWMKWSEPENLGPKLNTSGWDAYFVIASIEEYAYMVASQPDAESDVFRIKVPPSMRPNPVVFVSGKVLNSKTKQPVAAHIVYEILGTGSEAGKANANTTDGAYSIALPMNERFGVRAEAPGYYPISEELSTAAMDSTTLLQRNLLLTPIEIGATVRLSNVFFDYNKSELRSDSFSELDRLVVFLQNNSAMTIEVSGHTDAVGNDAFNQTLSEKRATAVADYLMKKGISPKRLRSKGYGKTKPVASNSTEEGRQLNRRVEFVILSM